MDSYQGRLENLCEHYGRKKFVGKTIPEMGGRKTQLLNEIDKRLPKDAIVKGKITKYMEAFLGGGAVFFHVAQRYNKIEHFYLLDVNEDLIGCYKAVRDNVRAVIAELEILKASYFARHTEDSRRELFEDIRTEFNLEKGTHFGFATAAKLIFLNKTCFNGLYCVKT